VSGATWTRGYPELSGADAGQVNALVESAVSAKEKPPQKETKYMAHWLTVANNLVDLASAVLTLAIAVLTLAGQQRR
jgi:hypothetical protein